MLALFWLGRMIEPALGHARFVAIYFASLLAGSLGVMILDPDTPTLGASGAVYGLLGAAIVMARNRNIDLIQSGLVPILALNLVLTLVLSTSISLGGHIGGLVGGLVATFVVEELASAGAHVDGPGRDRLRGDRRWRGRRRRSRPSRLAQQLAHAAGRLRHAGRGAARGRATRGPSTSRGPGRENQAAASATTIRSAPSAASRSRVGAAPPRSRARRRSRTARRSTTSGRAAATSSHERCSDGSPARPEQVDAAGVLDQLRHPVAADEDRVEPLEHRDAHARRVARPPAARGRSARRRPARGRRPRPCVSVAWASVRTSPSTSPSVCGSSETICGTGSIRSAIARTSSTDTAQTLHSAWVTIRSGCRSRSAALVELVDRAALLGQLAHGAVDLVGRQAGADHVAGDLG